MNSKRYNLRKIIPVTLLTATLAATSAHAGFFDRGMHHSGDMFMPIERMIDHVDLTDTQEQQIEKILDVARQEAGDLKQLRHRHMKRMIINTPDTEDYMVNVEVQASEIAEQVKDKIVLVAKVRQDIYQILTPEQKEDLAAHLEKRIERMSKSRRHQRNDD